MFSIKDFKEYQRSLATPVVPNWCRAMLLASQDNLRIYQSLRKKIRLHLEIQKNDCLVKKLFCRKIREFVPLKKKTVVFEKEF